MSHWLVRCWRVLAPIYKGTLSRNLSHLGVLVIGEAAPSAVVSCQAVLSPLLQLLCRVCLPLPRLLLSRGRGWVNKPDQTASGVPDARIPSLPTSCPSNVLKVKPKGGMTSHSHLLCCIWGLFEGVRKELYWGHNGGHNNNICAGDERICARRGKEEN